MALFGTIFPVIVIVCIQEPTGIYMLQQGNYYYSLLVYYSNPTILLYAVCSYYIGCRDHG